MIRIDRPARELSRFDAAINAGPRAVPAPAPRSLDAFAAPTARSTRVTLPVASQGQGDTNACGTTSLAMVLTYFGKPTTHQVIDREIRRGNMFSSPNELVDYARSQGMRAEMKLGASLEDVAALIDQGVPPMLLIDPSGDGSDFTLHYVVASGYERDASGKITSITLTDPAQDGSTYSIDAATMEARWSNLDVKGVGTGIDRLMISVAPGGNQPVTAPDGSTRPASSISLPKSSASDLLQAMPALQLANGLANVVNGFKNLDLGTLISGVGGTLGGLASFLLSKVPLLGKLAGPIAWGATQLGRGVEWVGNQFSNGAKAVADTLLDVGRGAAESVADAGRAVVNGVRDAGRAIRRFFGF